MPAVDVSTVLESGRPVGKAPGVKALRWPRALATFEVGSGTYDFETK
jgi:hypothetical protein